MRLKRQKPVAMVDLGRQPIADASRKEEKPPKQSGLAFLAAGLLDMFLLIPVLGVVLFVRPVMCIHRLLQAQRFGIATVLVVPLVVFAIFAVRDVQAKRLSKHCTISFGIAILTLIGLNVAVPDITIWSWD